MQCWGHGNIVALSDKGLRLASRSSEITPHNNQFYKKWLLLTLMLVVADLANTK